MSLIYPRGCEACGEVLLDHERLICTHCMVTLPVSGFHRLPDNPVYKALEGRVPLQQTASLYVFEKSGRVQQLLHAIKYEGRTELAEHLGLLLFEQLKHDPVFKTIDVLIPVPLHPKKYKARGYNQSELFAKGLNSGMQKELRTNALLRLKETSTQTRKRKFERWENVEGVFGLNPDHHLDHKHVLLVDDVLTTGATVEAAWLALSQVPGITVSLATLAYAEK